MGATPQPIQVALRYDGEVFVPDRPFPNLPPGTVIHVWTSTEPTNGPPGYVEGASKPMALDEIQRLLDSTAGAWADFDFVEPEELP